MSLQNKISFKSTVSGSPSREIDPTLDPQWLHKNKSAQTQTSGTTWNHHPHLFFLFSHCILVYFTPLLAAITALQLSVWLYFQHPSGRCFSEFQIKETYFLPFIFIIVVGMCKDDGLQPDKYWRHTFILSFLFPQPNSPMSLWAFQTLLPKAAVELSHEFYSHKMILAAHCHYHTPLDSAPLSPTDKETLITKPHIFLL